MLQAILRSVTICLMSISIVHAATWSLAISEPFGQIKNVLVEAESFSVEGDVVGFWVKMIPTDTAKKSRESRQSPTKSQVKKILSDMKINCRTREMTILAQQFFFDDGTKEFETADKPTWGRPDPEWNPIFDYCSAFNRTKAKYLPSSK